MALNANRRPVMTLYSKPMCPLSHRVRIVLAEKNVTANVISVEGEELPEDLMDINPYHSVPTLVDRDLVIYHSKIIMEYLDERYPHPSLVPVDPVSRARTRMMMHRVDHDWYTLLEDLEAGVGEPAENARKIISDGLTTLAPVMEDRPFLMGEEYSMVDCSLSPILWRLEEYGIKLPKQASSIHRYAQSLFSRETFKQSLTEDEWALAR